MSKIQTHQKEILEKFDAFFCKYCESHTEHPIVDCRAEEGRNIWIKGMVKKALHSQVEVIRDTVGSFVAPKHQGIGEDEFFCGFTEAKERVLMLLTPHEEEKK